MKALSIRLRLTLWYGVVLAATLVGCGLAVYVLLSLSLLRDIDRRLDGQYDAIRDRLGEGKDLDGVLDREEDHHLPFLVRLSKPDGTVIVESDPLRSHPVSPPPGLGNLSRPVFYDDDASGLGPHRFLAATVRRGSEEWLCQVGTSLSDYYQRMAELQTALLMILDGCLSLCVPVLHRLGGRQTAEKTTGAYTQIDLVCPRCGERGSYPLGDIKCPKCSLGIRVQIGEGPG